MEFYLSSHRMTVWVKTHNYVIVDSAPIIAKFRGQPINNLSAWMSRQGGFVRHRLKVRKPS